MAAIDGSQLFSEQPTVDDVVPNRGHSQDRRRNPEKADLDAVCGLNDSIQPTDLCIVLEELRLLVLANNLQPTDSDKRFMQVAWDSLWGDVYVVKLVNHRCFPVVNG